MKGFACSRAEPTAQARPPCQESPRSRGRTRPDDTQGEANTLWRARHPTKGFGRSIREGQKPPGAIRPAIRPAKR
jgi:hypothetical protein